MSEGSPRPGTGRLAVKIFVVALVAALLVAAAVLAAHYAWAPQEETTTEDALSRGRIVYTASQRDRYARLGLAARLLAAEPALVSVLSGEAGNGDDETPAAALADLLLQRREELGYDTALVLDGDGAVVAASEAPDLVGTNLTDRALVGRGLDEGVANGVWRRGDGRLAHASIVWVTPEFELLGYVVTTATLDEVLALEIERTSGADAVFLTGDGGGVRSLGSSLDAAANAELAGRIGSGSGGLAGSLDAGEVREGLTADLDGEAHDLLTMPLRDARDGTVGTLVLAVARRGAAFDPLPLALGAGLLAGLLVAFLVALLVARGTLAPVGRLTAMVTAAPREGFARHPEPGRHGHLAPLAAALGRLFRGLQEDRVLADTASRAGAAAAAADHAAAAGEEPRAARAAVVAVDLRRYARADANDLPRDVAERVARDAGRVRALVAARGGHLAGNAGHRLLAAFEGEDAVWDAVTAGAAVLATLGERESAFDETEPPAVAVAHGPVIGGPLTGGSGDAFLVGPAVQLADSLLREAGAGDLVLPRAVHSAVAEKLSLQGAAASEQRGVLTPQPIFVLAASAAGRLAGAVPVAPTSAGPGDVLEGRFEVVERVAAAVDGELLRVGDRELGEVVALRRFAPGIVRLPAGSFDAPLGAARRFAHPSVARLHDYGETEGGPGTEQGFYLSREWVPGVGAHRLGAMPPSAALGLSRQLALALAAIHGAGLVHGRLKPENVLVAADGTVRLTDLGVSTLVGSAPSRAVGQRMLAPEQADGAAGDARSDVYAAGALLAWLATGEWWSGFGAVPDASAVSPALGAFLARCLAQEPGQRFADGGEMVIGLEGVSA
jgi:class 3 adenylate cyclase